MPALSTLGDMDEAKRSRVASATAGECEGKSHLQAIVTDSALDWGISMPQQ